LKHRELLAAKKAEEERKKKELEDKVARLSKEMLDLIEESESISASLKELAKPLAVNFEDDKNFEGKKGIDDEELAKLVMDVRTKCKDAEATNKRNTTYIMQNGPELKSLGPQYLKIGQQSDIQKLLARQLKQVQELSQATADSQKALRVAEEGLKKRRKAKEFYRERDRLFLLYDEDKDGMLSRKEARRYAKAEFEFKPSEEVLDRVWKHNVEISEETLEERIGIKRESFRWLELAVGVGRELARNGKRKAERIDKERVLVLLKETLKPGMADAARAANAAETSLSNAEKKLTPLKVVTMDVDAMSAVGEEAEAALADGRSTVGAVRKQIDDLAINGVEPRCHEDIKLFLNYELRRTEAQMGRMELRLQRATNLIGRFRKNVLYKQAKALRAELEIEEKARDEEERVRAAEEKAKADEEAAKAKAEQAVADNSKAEACENCGAAWPLDHKFCMKCGNKRAEPVPQAVPVDTSQGVNPSLETASNPPLATEEAEQPASREEVPPVPSEKEPEAEVAVADVAVVVEAEQALVNGEPVAAEMKLSKKPQDEGMEEKPQPSADVIRIPDGGEDEADVILQSVAKDFGEV